MRNSALEGIRGIAAIIVVVGHFMSNYWRTGFETVAGTPLFVFFNGPAAVVIFFVLSGYVLTAAAFRADNTVPLVEGALKRWPRLAGTVVAASLLYMAAHAIGAIPSGDYVLARMDQPLGILTWGQGRLSDPVGILNEASWQTYFLGAYRHNDVLWVLMFETYGAWLAMACAAALVALKWPVGLPIFLGLMTLAILFGPSVDGLRGPLYYLPFCLGVAIAYLRLSIPLFVGIPALALALITFGYREPEGMYSFMAAFSTFGGNQTWILVQSSAAVLFIGTIVHCKPIGAFLGGGWARVLGKYSFGIYLTHSLVLWGPAAYVYLLFPARGPLAIGSAMLVTILGTAILGYVISRFDDVWTKLLNNLFRRKAHDEVEAASSSAPS